MPILSPERDAMAAFAPGAGRLTPLAMDRAAARLEPSVLSVGLGGLSGAQVESFGQRISGLLGKLGDCLARRRA